MEKYMLFGGADSSDDGPLDIPEYMKNDEPGDTQSSFSGEEKAEKEARDVRSWSSIEEEEDYEEDEYRREGRRTARRRRGPFRIAAYAITAIVVVAVVIAVAVLAGRRQFETYRVLRTERLEDTVTSSYDNVNGNILQFGTDMIRLQTRQGEEIWNISCSLKGPKLVKCGNTLALYDQGGTDVVVAGRDGKLGSFTTRLPIVKASVSARGNVAAILEDGANAWIEYYAVDGTEIAAIRTSMDNPGYPMAVTVSPNGQLLAVSYLNFTDGVQKSEVHIYSFGTAGQNQMDNRIGAFTFPQKIVPDLTYLSDSTCVAFRDNGFTILEGAKVPKVTREVEAEGEICSIFYDSEHIGLIETGEEEGGYRMLVYTPSGGEVLDQPFDFPFSSVEIYGSDITLYDGPAFEVYGMNGVCRFKGSYSGDARQLFTVGKQRYVAVTDSGFELIELR